MIRLLAPLHPPQAPVTRAVTLAFCRRQALGEFATQRHQPKALLAPRCAYAALSFGKGRRGATLLNALGARSLLDEFVA